MTYLLVVFLFGQSFVLDHGLSQEDCEAYLLSAPFACVKDLAV